MPEQRAPLLAELERFEEERNALRLRAVDAAIDVVCWSELSRKFEVDIEYSACLAALWRANAHHLRTVYDLLGDEAKKAFAERVGERTWDDPTRMPLFDDASLTWLRDHKLLPPSDRLR